MPRAYISLAVRRLVIERAHERCEYCQSRTDFATETFAVDHIQPLSRAGTDDLVNLALACSGCNSRKYDKVEAPDPISGMVVPLFNPRVHLWSDHFRWNEDYTRVLGLTDIGRATVVTLQMNRASLINIRTAMFLMGLHPPN